MINVVRMPAQVPSDRIRVLPMGRPTVVRGCHVTPIPANHCPGAVMLLFATPGHAPVLHSGDCRYHRGVFQGCSALTPLRGSVILHLDTTYCAPQHSFPLQEDVVHAVCALCTKVVREAAAVQEPPPLLVFGSYTIGKERLFLEVRAAPAALFSLRSALAGTVHWPDRYDADRLECKRPECNMTGVWNDQMAACLYSLLALDPGRDTCRGQCSCRRAAEPCRITCRWQRSCRARCTLRPTSGTFWRASTCRLRSARC